MTERLGQTKQRIWEMRAALKARHLEERAQLDQQILQLQRRCLHPETEYHPDPSGNNDSWTECQECGARLGRR